MLLYYNWIIEINAKYHNYRLSPNWRQLRFRDSSNLETNALENKHTHTDAQTHTHSHPLPPSLFSSSKARSHQREVQEKGGHLSKENFYGFPRSCLALHRFTVTLWSQIPNRCSFPYYQPLSTYLSQGSCGKGGCPGLESTCHWVC